MNITPLSKEEKQALAHGWKLKVLRGETIFPRYSSDGLPVKEVYRAYFYGEGEDRFGQWFPAGEWTPEELDAMPIYNSDGTPKKLTYGEYKTWQNQT